eukprot:s359_g21.t1
MSGRIWVADGDGERDFWVAECVTRSMPNGLVSVWNLLYGVSGLFAGSFLLLCIDQRMFFEAAMRLQSLGYGGVLCLAADLGTAFGFLYQILTVTFMLFNWACVPSTHCVGAECFKGFFNLSGVLHAGCVLWGVKIVVKKSFMAGENPRMVGGSGGAAKPSEPPKATGKAQPSSTSNSGTDSDSSSSGSSAAPKALLNAAKAGDLAQVSSLVKGAQAKDLTAALHAACSEGHRKLVAPLCKGKADVNGLDNSGLTPLHVAAFRGDDAVVQALCQLGANVKAVDEEGWTPLYVVAAFGGQEDVFKTLLAAKSDAKFTTPSGTTISMAAKQKGFTQLLKLL